MANNTEKVKKPGSFSCFSKNPVNVAFENQDEKEKIILFLRAHPITLVSPVIIVIFLIIFPFIAGAVLSLLNIELLASLTSGQVFWLAVSWYLFVFGFAFFRFVLWYFNVYFVTNERIVDFDIRGILNKQISFTTLNHIEDIAPKTIGFFGTFFNYGTVYVQTAAERPEFEFENVPRPDDVAHIILEQVRLEEGEAPGEVG